ncbi:MAG TPA: thioredoxin-dependent thiol peroxidase [Candidatus Intestinimonas stercoravium]|nr:thioredoxin-dependent thiol peroxidase [Candidatus Intestinimonas stercoravium]
MLKAGDMAPAFTLLDQNGDTVSLSDYRGQRTVVYFYPKDSTPGCTREACAFAGALERFQALGVPVLGISKDSVASHAKFAAKHQLPFRLLSDPERTAIQGFGVWQEKKLYGKVSMGVVRSTFLVDGEGKIEKVWPKVRPDSHPEEILAYLTGEKV